MNPGALRGGAKCCSNSKGQEHAQLEEPEKHGTAGVVAATAPPIGRVAGFGVRRERNGGDRSLIFFRFIYGLL